MCPASWAAGSVRVAACDAPRLARMKLRRAAADSEAPGSGGGAAAVAPCGTGVGAIASRRSIRSSRSSSAGSDVDAALHYLARMLGAGEDPRFIARRVVIAASEDIGLADPSALQTAVAAMHAVAQIGMPEARIILAQAVVHVVPLPAPAP